VGAPSEPAAQAELAGQWWTLAQSQPLTTRLRMQERAAYWYERALPRLLGAKKDEAAARIASAKKALPEVVLMPLPIAVDAGKARKERDALRGGDLLGKTRITESVVIDGDRPFRINGTLAAPDEGTPVDITLGPGAEIRGGKINLWRKGHLKLQGSAEKPVVLRDVEIMMDHGGSFEAEYAVLDGCRFVKGGRWFAYHSSKWSFRNCTLYNSKFAKLTGVDYGFKLESCRLIGMTFPEIIHNRKAGAPFNHMDNLRQPWNRIFACEFVDCVVTPTVAWCAESSNFIGCKFIHGESFEGNEDFQWSAFLAETSGESPQVVFDARPSGRGKVKVISAAAPAEVPRVGERLIPEITYATRAVAKNN
jgi:hypothetical protein